MRVRAIVGQHIAVKLGRSREVERSEKHFLFGAFGTCLNASTRPFMHCYNPAAHCIRPHDPRPGRSIPAAAACVSTSPDAAPRATPTPLPAVGDSAHGERF